MNVVISKSVQFIVDLRTGTSLLQWLIWRDVVRVYVLAQYRSAVELFITAILDLK